MAEYSEKTRTAGISVRAPVKTKPDKDVYI